MANNTYRTPEYIGWPGAADEEKVLEVMAGYPTSYPESMEDQIKKTMPIVYIQPCIQSFAAGLELYTLDPGEGWNKYKEYLKASGVEINSQMGDRLKIIYNNVSSLGESYSSNFSQSSLSSMMESTASQGLQDIISIMGNGGGLEEVGKNAQKSENEFIKKLGDLGIAGLDKAKKGINSIDNARTRNIAQQLFNVAKDPTARLDFPLMWRSSNYSASYNLNIRLYNPNPANNDQYGSLIVASLGALLGLCLPVAGEDNDDLYRWPFICKVEIPGLMRMDAAYVSNISVVKGGDVNDLSWNQKWIRPNLIDMQLTLSPLYNVMIMSKVNSASKERPTLKKELEVMMGETKDPNIPITTAPAEQQNDTTISRTITPQQQNASDALTN